MAWGCALTCVPLFDVRTTCLTPEVCRVICRVAPGVIVGDEPSFGGAVQLWLPMERFDDGMLLLGRTLGWSLLDVTYTVLFDSRQDHASRWDGKLIKPTPKASSLSRDLVDSIKQLNHLDGLIYDHATRLFDQALAAAKGKPGTQSRAAWDADYAEFARMRTALAASFNASDSVAACAALRTWYTLSDVSYEVRACVRALFCANVRHPAGK